MYCDHSTMLQHYRNHNGLSRFLLSTIQGPTFIAHHACIVIVIASRGGAGVHTVEHCTLVTGALYVGHGYGLG